MAKKTKTKREDANQAAFRILREATGDSPEAAPAKSSPKRAIKRKSATRKPRKAAPDPNMTAKAMFDEIARRTERS